MRVYTANDVDNYTNNYNRLVDEIEALLKYMKTYNKASEEYLHMCQSLEILYRIQTNANLKSAIDDMETELHDPVYGLGTKASGVISNETGRLLSITKNVVGSTLADEVVNIVPQQDTSSGDPSSTNVCSITGVTGTRISVTGYNLWDEEYLSKHTVDLYTGEVVSTGDNRICSKNMIPVIPGSTIYLIIPSGGLRFVNYKADGTYRGYTGWFNNSGLYTIPDNAYFIRFFFFFSYGTTYKNDIGINYPSTKRVYETHGESVEYDWSDVAGTVYGGSFSTTTGILSVTHGNIESYNGETLPGKWLSSMDVYTEQGTPTTGAQVVYELANPVTYQLDPHTFTTYPDITNVWASAGDSITSYFTDTQEYINDTMNSYDVVHSQENTMNEFVELANEQSTLSPYVKFINGGLYVTGSNAGEIALSAVGRVVSKDIISLDKTITLKTKNDSYDIVYATYNDDDSVKNVVGNLTTVTIPAGQKFRVSIRELPVSDAVPIDIPSTVKMATFSAYDTIRINNVDTIPTIVNLY